MMEQKNTLEILILENRKEEGALKKLEQMKRINCS